MWFTTHAITGVVISQTVPTVPAIVGVSLLSHIILDTLPHGDNILIGNDMATPLDAQIDKKRKFFLYAFIDAGVSLTALAILIFTRKMDFGLMFWGITGAVFFDVVSSFNYFFRWKWLNNFEHFHIWLHTILTKYFKKGDISPKFALGLQIIFVVVVLGALVY
ncbi:MAG: hypothetical protein ABIF80_00865 [Patescibacteria group bacterium]